MNSMTRMINVGLAEVIVSYSPDVLLCVALGSCVAIILYDFESMIGGLAHIMLPYGNEMEINHKPGKFADTAVEFMLEEMLKKGAKKEYIKAKIVGGAHMFSENSKSFNKINSSIGAKNIYAVKQILSRKHIPIEKEDTGKNYARSLEFFLDSGKVIIKSIRKGTREI
ncbi:MAG: chemotaxis protein CheD [Actinobacteria bacterium]|nr:chemotaxis protein CheD [Actinomycetota bacterium]